MAVSLISCILCKSLLSGTLVPHFEMKMTAYISGPQNLDCISITWEKIAKTKIAGPYPKSVRLGKSEGAANNLPL